MTHRLRRFQDAKVVVVGGSGSIGGACVVSFAEEGAEVVNADITGGADVHVDVTDESSVRDLFEGFQPDVLVNAFGITLPGPAESITNEEWGRVLAVNLTGVFLCCQGAARYMLDRGGGAIVNVASIAALRALPGRLSYSVSKAGIVSLTEVMAVEWAGRGVRVNSVAPGWVDTPLFQAAVENGLISEAEIRDRVPQGRLARIDETADAVLFLASSDAGYITGTTLVVDGGFTPAGQVVLPH